MRWFLFFIVLLVIESVLGVGLTPAHQTITYDDSSVVNGRIKVIGDGQMILSSSDARLVLERSKVEGDTIIGFTVRMTGFEPGATPIHITATKLLEGGMISSEAMVTARVVVERPVGDRYATFEVFPPREGADSFYVRVTNRGTQPLVRAQVVIDVTEGAFSQRFSSDTRSIGVSESILIPIPARLNDGAYAYEAVLNYDGEVSRQKGSFVKGRPDIVYTGFFVRDFTLGSLNEFVVMVDNRFNRKVLADVVVELSQGGTTIDRFSQQALLEPLVERALSAYIDTARAVRGDATLSVELEYEGSRRTREQPVTLTDSDVLIAGQVVGEGGSVNLVLLLVLIGVLANVILIVALFRRQK